MLDVFRANEVNGKDSEVVDDGGYLIKVEDSVELVNEPMKAISGMKVIQTDLGALQDANKPAILGIAQEAIVSTCDKLGLDYKEFTLTKEELLKNDVDKSIRLTTESIESIISLVIKGLAAIVRRIWGFILNVLKSLFIFVAGVEKDITNLVKTQMNVDDSDELHIDGDGKVEDLDKAASSHESNDAINNIVGYFNNLRPDGKINQGWTTVVLNSILVYFDYLSKVKNLADKVLAGRELNTNDYPTIRLSNKYDTSSIDSEILNNKGYFSKGNTNKVDELLGLPGNPAQGSFMVINPVDLTTARFNLDIKDSFYKDIQDAMGDTIYGRDYKQVINQLPRISNKLTNDTKVLGGYENKFIKSLDGLQSKYEKADSSAEVKEMSKEDSKRVVFINSIVAYAVTQTASACASTIKAVTKAVNG